MNKNKSINRIWWVQAALVLACLVFSYWSTIQQLVAQWLNSDDYSHGLLILPISVYLIWEKRSELKKVSIKSDWRALPVLFFAVFVFVVGELGAELFTTRVSILIFVVGLTWFLFGFTVLRLLWFPLAFLFLMLPLPGFIYRNITFPLQLLSSAWSVDLLHALGVSAYREGNVIDIGYTQLQVVEACNGLRYILPLFTLGVLFAYFSQKTIWKRIVLVAATIPISIFANVIRIAGTGYIGKHWGTQAAEGFFHSFSGWVVFMLAAVFFGLLSLLLKYLPGGKSKERKSPLSSTSGEVLRNIGWPCVMFSMAIILVSPFFVNYLGQVPPVALKKPLSTFPLQFEGRTGKRSGIDPKIWEQVGGQSYLNIDYYRDNEVSINFYVAYYEYQRKAGDFIHSPKLCLPGGGWFIEQSSVRHLKQPSDVGRNLSELKLNELVISKGGFRQLSYYWYQGRGRNFTSEYDAKFYMVWDGLWRRRTDGALVRVVMPLVSGVSVENGRHILDKFALAASRALEEYLP